MCDLFGPSDSDKAQIQAQQDAAAKAEAAAIAEQNAARQQAAQIAADGASGGEKARKAAEQKLKSMQSGVDPFAFGGAPVAQGSVGYRLAMGA